MVNCTTCGSNVPREARFCQACGAPTVHGLLSESAVSVPPAIRKRKLPGRMLMVIGASVVVLTGTVAAAASALSGG